jgi:sec-independent protein translocase protein TatB
VNPGWTPAYQPPRKRWRMKRGAVPRWYKQREGVRMHVQSGAARVARFRPPAP